MFSGIYIKNETVIIKIDIVKALKKLCKRDNVEYVYAVERNIHELSEFYISSGRKDFTADYVEEQLYNNCEFHILRHDGKIVAGMIIHNGEVEISTPSFFALKDEPNEVVVFDENVIYSSHNIVSEKYRGRHLYSILLRNVLQTFEGSKDTYVIITGIDNKRMLQSSFDIGGKLIGYVITKRILHVFWKKKIKYLSEKEICWKSISKEREISK